LPHELGFAATPAWWPLLPLGLSGLLCALSIRHLPGTGGHSPADGLKPAGATAPIDLPGIVCAAFATLALGAVLGPEAPLIAAGSGFGVLAVRLLKRDAPAMASLVIGTAGSFAAISTLLASPLVAAFLIMEVAGIGGALLEIVLIPGLLAAGIGALIFIGLDSWTGYGTFSLAIGHVPPLTTLDGWEFLWALGIGLAAAAVGIGLRRFALLLRPIVAGHAVILTTLVGLAVAGIAIGFAEASGRDVSYVLFSGQVQLAPLVEGAGTWTVGALALLLVCKGVAYSGCLSCFRGGPIFPAIFLGATGGILLSHLPGLPMIAGVAMGIGAMTTVMLNGMPLSSVVLVAVLIPTDALKLSPIVIIATVVAYVLSQRLAPSGSTAGTAAAAGRAAPTAAAAHVAA
jgi:H+/Cl- antiporter ClcA